MPEQTSVPSQDVLDVPLNLFEYGPDRTMLEGEFNAALMNELRVRPRVLSSERERALHDCVLPHAFDALFAGGQKTALKTLHSWLNKAVKLIPL